MLSGSESSDRRSNSSTLLPPPSLDMLLPIPSPTQKKKTISENISSPNTSFRFNNLLISDSFCQSGAEAWGAAYAAYCGAINGLVVSGGHAEAAGETGSGPEAWKRRVSSNSTTVGATGTPQFLQYRSGPVISLEHARQIVISPPQEL